MVFKFLSRVISTSFLIAFCASMQEAQAERRGIISSGRCPYNCASQNVPKEFCREWNQGSNCFVEDSRPSSKQTVGPRVDEPKSPSVPTLKNDSSAGTPFRSWSGSGTEYQSDQERDYYECKKADYLGKPRINVHRLKQSGTSFKEKFRISGSVEGVCIVEAGYFEFGKKIEDIRVRPDRKFKRFDFDVIVKGDRAPEIRVYNINGDRDVYSIADDEYEHERDRNDSRWRR